MKGKRHIKADIIDGEINYLGAISENNGIRQHIEADKKSINKANCITLNYNGSVGEAFYQNMPFWHLMMYIFFIQKLFICTIINPNRYKFSYGRKWTLEKMKKSIIKLPVNSDKEPYFEYMENFIKLLPYSDRILFSI